MCVCVCVCVCAYPAPPVQEWLEKAEQFISSEQVSNLVFYAQSSPGTLTDRQMDMRAEGQDNSSIPS